MEPRATKKAKTDAVISKVLHVGGASMAGIEKIIARFAAALEGEEPLANLLSSLNRKRMHVVNQTRLHRLESDGSERCSGFELRSGSQRCDRRLFKFTIGARFASMKATVVLPLIDGGEFSWEFVDPAKLLSEAVANVPDLQELYSRALSVHRCSPEEPWNIAVGFDEFTPGNKLNLDNRRKAMVLSFTFLELGQPAVTHGRAWLTPVVIRSTVLHDVEGGWARCLSTFLERLLFAPSGLAAGGVPILVGGQPILLFGKLSNLLSDGEGLQHAFDWKGHSSFKSCIKHYNVFKKVLRWPVIRLRK
jgi:hypothetical protein